jgi:lincosamide nucleotidyltransferase A/C/D/E
VVRAVDVLGVLDALQAKGLRVWLDGGWGVDALLGEETRGHEDLDLVVEFEALTDVMAALSALGFHLAQDNSPVRLVLRTPDGRQADLHPVTFAQDGTAWQRGASPDGSDCPYPAWGFGHGRILDRPVPCLTAELQLEHHRGYEPRERDRVDMAHLGRRFGLSLTLWETSSSTGQTRPVSPTPGIVPEFYCSDFERSLAFYIEVIGFQVLYERRAERFAYLDLDGAQLMIEQTVDRHRTLVTAELSHPFGRGVNLQIPVRDVDLLLANVAGAGGPIVLPLEERWYRRDDVELGVRQFVCADPDGYLLRFSQSLGERVIA